MPFFVLLFALISGNALAFPNGVSAWFIRPVFPMKQAAVPTNERGNSSHRVGIFDVTLEGKTDRIDIQDLEITGEGLRFGMVRGEAGIRKISVGSQRMVVDLGVTKIDGGLGLATIDNFKVVIASRGPIVIPLPHVIRMTVDPDKGLDTRMVDGSALIAHFVRELTRVFSREGFDDAFLPIQTSSTGLEKEVFDHIMNSKRDEFIGALRESVVREVQRPPFLDRIEREIGKSIRGLNMPWTGKTEIVLERSWLPIDQIDPATELYGAVSAWRLSRLEKENALPPNRWIAPLNALGRANLITVAASESALENLLAVQAERQGIRLSEAGAPRNGYVFNTSARESETVRTWFASAQTPIEGEGELPTALWVEQRTADAPEVRIEAGSDHGTVTLGVVGAPLFGRFGTSSAPPQKLWLEFRVQPGLKLEMASGTPPEGSPETPAPGMFAALGQALQEKLMLGLLQQEIVRGKSWTSRTDIGVIHPYDLRLIPTTKDREGFILIDLRLDGTPKT